MEWEHRVSEAKYKDSSRDTIQDSHKEMKSNIRLRYFVAFIS